MVAPELIYQNSTFFENLLEHRFVFELGRALLLREIPELLNVLKGEVDMFGFDLVLGSGDRVIHTQMKTRSKAPPPNTYDIQENLWSIPNAAVIWVLYDQDSIDPIAYYLFGNPMPPMSNYGVGKRAGFRAVKMQHGTRFDTITALADTIFPRKADEPSRAPEPGLPRLQDGQSNLPAR
jgi:hypothetical protein